MTIQSGRELREGEINFASNDYTPYGAEAELPGAPDADLPGTADAELPGMVEAELPGTLQQETPPTTLPPGGDPIKK